MEFNCPDVHLIVDVYTLAVQLIDTTGCFTVEALRDKLFKVNTGWSETEVVQALDHLAGRDLLSTSVAGGRMVDVWFPGQLYPRKENR